MSTNGKKWMKRLNVVIMKRYIFYGISKVKGVDFGVGGGGRFWGASPYTTLLKTSRGPIMQKKYVRHHIKGHDQENSVSETPSRIS